MTAIVERKTSHAAYWARRVGWFSLVLLMTASVSHRFGLLETPPFLTTLALVAGLALLALLLAMIGMVRLWQVGARGGGAATSGLVLALLVLTPFGLGAYRYWTYPKLTDISTDLLSPPHMIAARAMRSGDMNGIVLITPEEALTQADFYTSLTGRRYALPATLVLKAIEDLIAARGWTIERPAGDQLEGGEVTIEALAPLTLLGMQSDMAVRLTNEGDTVYVDMRGVSRYGTHDLGINAAAIEDFLRNLDEEVVTRALTAPPETEQDDG